MATTNGHLSPILLAILDGLPRLDDFIFPLGVRQSYLSSIFLIYWYKQLMLTFLKPCFRVKNEFQKILIPE